MKAITEFKICPRCLIKKPLIEFYKDKSHKDGLRTHCKICCSKRDKLYKDKNKISINKKRIEYYKKYPWKRTLSLIKARCNNKNNNRYKNYGGRGIKCLITEKELEYLWFRDKAYLLNQSSIDRKNNDDNYTVTNCKFIEKSKNSSKDKYKEIEQYTLNGKFIKKWNSLKEAANSLNIYAGNISHCIRGIRKSTGGFKWQLVK